MAQTEVIARSTHSESLAEVLERVLDKGLVIAGDIKIKLCDVELLSIQIRLLICSVDKAKEMGMTWWWEQAAPTVQTIPPPHVPQKPLPAPEAGTQMPSEQSRRFHEVIRAVAEGPR
jgi:hypothetical protein